MFRGFRGNLLKFILVVVFGLITFWPNYGLAFGAYYLFPHAQIPVTIGASIWSIFFMLFLPFQIRIFQHASTIFILIMFGVSFLAAFQRGMVNPMELTFWLTWGIAGLFSLIAWLMVSAPLWRVFHGVTPVQETVEEHHDS